MAFVVAVLVLVATLGLAYGNVSSTATPYYKFDPATVWLGVILAGAIVASHWYPLPW